MTPNEALQLYTAVKLHFSSKYDAFKYNFKVRKIDFTKRKDKHFFNKLSKFQDPHGLLVANLSSNPNIWVGRLFETEALDRYWQWKKYQESQTYLFKEELSSLDHFGFTAWLGENEYPPALKLYLRKRMSLDTLTIANDFFRMIPRWDQVFVDDPIWDEIRMKILKYRPFITYNRDSILPILREKFLT